LVFFKHAEVLQQPRSLLHTSSANEADLFGNVDGDLGTREL